MKFCFKRMNSKYSLAIKSGVSIIISVFLILISLQVLAHSPAHQTEKNKDSIITNMERQWLDNNPDKLNLFYNTEFPPIEFVSKNGKFIGMGADIIKLVEKRLGVVFRKSACEDWDKHLLALKSGKCAIAPTIVQTKGRSDYAFFTTPYATVPVVIITKSDEFGELTLDDLDGMKVAVVSEFATEKHVRDRSKGRFKIVLVKNVSEGVRKVSFGQVDALIENLAVASYFIEQEGISNLSVAGNGDYYFAWSIGISKKYPLLYSSIQKALDSITAEELDDIRKRWISLESHHWLDSETLQMVKIGAIFFVLLILGLIGVSYFLKRQLAQKVESLRNAQKELIEQAEQISLANEVIGVGVWEYLPDTKELSVSEEWYLMLGHKPGKSTISLTDWIEMVHPDDKLSLLDSFNAYLKTDGQELFVAEFRMANKNGWRWLLGKGRTIEWDKDLKPKRFIALNLDIQNIKEYQEKLTESEQRFRAIFEHAPFPIAINNAVSGEYLDVNVAFLESRNATKEELDDLHIFDKETIFTSGNENVIEDLLENGSIKNKEAIVKKLDGSFAHIIYSSVLLEMSGEKQAVSMIVDVTDKKLAEIALRESEETFRALSENSKDVIMRFDRDRRHTYVNNIVEKISGIPADQFIGKTHEEIGFPESLCTLWNNALDRTFSTSETTRVEFQLPNQIWMESLAMPEFDKDGKVNAIIASSRNITERKKAEQEKKHLEDQLQQAVKMDAIGRLAGGVAHDFNNMLGVILGSAELAQEGKDNTELLSENLEEIIVATQRAADLTRQLLAFARKQTMEPEVVNLNDSVEGTLNMLRRLIGENIDLSWKPDSNLWNIKIDPSQLDQILANLCVNAKDAIDDVGLITIRTQNIELDESSCANILDITPGEYVLLEISDNGEGMDASTQKHVFEPFYTTKGVGEGTGLGLSMVYGIIKQNNGYINLYSEPDLGTTFKIYFPCESGTTDQKKAFIGSNELPAGKETILIVEDEPAILKMTASMLEQLGYIIITANSPELALKEEEEFKDNIDLLITDVIMPGMNGLMLKERIKASRPNIRSLFMSGYTADVIVDQGILNEGVNFLPKPFTMISLAEKVREILDS